MKPNTTTTPRSSASRTSKAKVSSSAPTTKATKKQPPTCPCSKKIRSAPPSGRLGIYLGRLNYLRLDSDTLVELQKIPQLRKTDLNVRVEKGGIYLDIESLDNEKGIEIQTPDCGIFLLDKGVYRINVIEDPRTEVLRHGRHRRSRRPGKQPQRQGKPEDRHGRRRNRGKALLFLRFGQGRFRQLE